MGNCSCNPDILHTDHLDKLDVKPNKIVSENCEYKPYIVSCKSFIYDDIVEYQNT